jgi:hypothetical protein
VGFEVSVPSPGFNAPVGRSRHAHTNTVDCEMATNKEPWWSENCNMAFDLEGLRRSENCNVVQCTRRSENWMLLNAMQNPADCCSMQEKVWELQCCWTQCKILLIVKWMMLVKNNIIHFHCSMLPCINSVHLITKSRSRRTAQNWRISRWYNHLGHNADYFMAVYGNFAMNHNINRQRKHNMNNVKKVFMKAVRG